MTYASQADLVTYAGETEIIQLTDRSSPPAYVIDAAVVAQALGEADDLINAHLATKYQLPLSQTPSLLKTCAIDIARYKLFRASPTDEVRTRYEEAMKTLRMISAGTMKLNVAETGVAPAARNDEILTSIPDRLFSRDTLQGF